MALIYDQKIFIKKTNERERERENNKCPISIEFFSQFSTGEKSIRLIECKDMNIRYIFASISQLLFVLGKFDIEN